MQKANRMNAKVLIIAYITLLAVTVNGATALSQPNTSIVAGPNGNISYNDVAFWWMGETTISDDTGRLPSIKGFYYSLDGEP